MQIVIEIPEDIYIHLLQRYKYQDTNDIGLSELDKASIAIKNSTSLPKGHGDLIDRKELLKEKRHFEDFDGDVFDIIHEETVINAPTIIPADKEE